MRVCLLLGLLLLISTSQAFGITVTANVINVQSWDVLDDSDNDTRNIDLGILAGLPTPYPMLLIGVEWNVTISTIGSSWLEEAACQISATTNSTVVFDLIPGAGDNTPGTQSYSSSGIYDFTDNGVSNIYLEDGIAALQFYELTDDYVDDIDADWTTAQIVFHIIPEPMITGISLNPDRQHIDLVITNMTPDAVHRFYLSSDLSDGQIWGHLGNITPINNGVEYSVTIQSSPIFNYGSNATYKIYLPTD